MKELKVIDLINILMGLSEEEQNAPIYAWFAREKSGFNIDGLVIEKDLGTDSTHPLWLRIDISRE
jgi:hypothetical protein